MSERKNIDRLFQEKFKDFEVEPSEMIWKNIESKLKEKKEVQKVIPLWIKLSGIAVALLIGVFTTATLLDSRKNNATNILIEENNLPNNTALNTIKNKETVISLKVSDKENETAMKKFSSNKNEKAVPDNQILNAFSEEKIKHSNATNNTVTQNEASNGKIEKNSNPNSLKKRINNNVTVAGRTFTERKPNPVSRTDSKGKNNLKNRLKSDKNKVIVTHDFKDDSKKNAKNNSFKNKKGNNFIAGNPNKVTNSRLNKQHYSQDKLVENTSENKTENNQNKIIATNKEPETNTLAIVNSKALETKLEEKEKKIVVKKPKLNRWQISSNVAPIYFSSASNGSPLDSQFKNNNKNYKTNLAYGLGVKYALNSKFSLRSGVNTVALEYDTDGVVFYQNQNARELKNISKNHQGLLMQIENKNTSPEAMQNDPNITKYDGKLNQKIGYIEVPLELTYKILDQKLGIELIGGLSTLFLNENKVSLVSSEVDMNIGKANNLNTMHFSTNIGLGFKYNFLKSFQANIEPMFKYQINTFSSDSGNFKPYILGLYTGVSYRF
jgi:hypothetical protein